MSVERTYAGGDAAHPPNRRNSNSYDGDLPQNLLSGLKLSIILRGMDEIDRKIVRLLGVDARRSLADIGQVVELSPSSVNERMRRMVVSGDIRRFTVDADPNAYGLPVLAFVWVALKPESDEAAFRIFAADHAGIFECHHVTGSWSYLVKVRVASLAGLEAFLDELKGGGFLARSETHIALSSAVSGGFAPATEIE